MLEPLLRHPPHECSPLMIRGLASRPCDPQQNFSACASLAIRRVGYNRRGLQA